MIRVSVGWCSRRPREHPIASPSCLCTVAPSIMGINVPHMPCCHPVVCRPAAAEAVLHPCRFPSHTSLRVPRGVSSSHVTATTTALQAEHACHAPAAACPCPFTARPSRSVLWQTTPKQWLRASRGGLACCSSTAAPASAPAQPAPCSERPRLAWHRPSAASTPKWCVALHCCYVLRATCHCQCYNVQVDQPLTAEEAATLLWLLRETFEPELLTPSSRLTAGAPTEVCPLEHVLLLHVPLQPSSSVHHLLVSTHHRHA